MIGIRDGFELETPGDPVDRHRLRCTPPRPTCWLELATMTSSLADEAWPELHKGTTPVRQPPETGHFASIPRKARPQDRPGYLDIE